MFQVLGGKAGEGLKGNDVLPGGQNSPLVQGQFRYRLSVHFHPLHRRAHGSGFAAAGGGGSTSGKGMPADGGDGPGSDGRDC